MKNCASSWQICVLYGVALARKAACRNWVHGYSSEACAAWDAFKAAFKANATGAAPSWQICVYAGAAAARDKVCNGGATAGACAEWRAFYTAFDRAVAGTATDWNYCVFSGVAAARSKAVGPQPDSASASPSDNSGLAAWDAFALGLGNCPGY